MGRTAASLAAHHYVSGISLGDGSFFGRRAGATPPHAPGKERSRGQRPVNFGVRFSMNAVTASVRSSEASIPAFHVAT